MNEGMNSIERRAASALSVIYAVRMLGLFMILPVFAIYAEALEGVTPILIGLAIGIYGLTQALLQVPMGMWSDRIGRKPVIYTGLVIFALGSVIAASSESIVWVIIGRALQGAGAVAAAIMALAADLTRDDQRTKVMASIGASIGFAFILALVLGPVLESWIGVPGIFWLTAVLAIIAIVLLNRAVPTPKTQTFQRDAQVASSGLRQVIADAQLLRLDFGVFILHLVLTANFIVIPVMLRDEFGMALMNHWKVYLGVMLMSIVLLIPSIFIAERLRRTKSLFLLAIAVCMGMELFIATQSYTFILLMAALVLYFWGFNFLEASMPTMVSRYSAPHLKGTSMGMYSSSQFMGAFTGGVSAGYILTYYDRSYVFAFCGLLMLIWLAWAATMKSPRNLSNLVLSVGKIDPSDADRLHRKLIALPGVAEAVIMVHEGVAYLKVDKQNFDQSGIASFRAGISK